MQASLIDTNSQIGAALIRLQISKIRLMLSRKRFQWLPVIAEKRKELYTRMSSNYAQLVLWR